ncbi:MAG: LysM peptidoglycan-binding domain-containing protein [Deltaproteobacteria bacterium]
MTVSDEPVTPARGQSALRTAAREHRSISLDQVDIAGSTTASDVPEFHTVERGDTLWDITGSYFQNPWRWPGVWGLNPQITNPHWIFPGDQVRLAAAADRPVRPTTSISSGAPDSLHLPSSRVPPQTVFLREQGWIDAQQEQAAGTIVGSPEDQMLLTEGDRAYVEFRNRTPRVGEQYTIYQEGQTAARGAGRDRSTGRVVRVLGAATVESWDRDRHVATVRLTESTDGIERGERVAAIPRRLAVVPPARNGVNLQANIVATLHPQELVGQNMVVFIDRGTADHLEAGNRLFVVRRGDTWRTGMISEAAASTGLDRDGDGNVDAPPGRSQMTNDLPYEIVGEILVVEVREHSASALVTSAIVEVEVGDRLEMRRGY